MINWSSCSSNSNHEIRRLYSQRIRSYMGSYGDLPPSINNIHAFKALQRQPFYRAKRKLHPALTAVITKLQYRDGSQDGNHLPMFQSTAQFSEHGHILTE